MSFGLDSRVSLKMVFEQLEELMILLLFDCREDLMVFFKYLDGMEFLVVSLKMYVLLSLLFLSLVFSFKVVISGGGLGVDVV